MGKRQNNISKYININYDFSTPEIPKLEDYRKSEWYDEIFIIYKKLGGVLNDIPFGIKKNHLDIVINGKILELDEENHFNCYRAITLDASIYNKNQTLNRLSYLDYCSTRQSECQTNGGYWASKSSEEQFGKSNTPGDLRGNGSSRWKQRAFYDMLKDFIPFISGISVKRISIYDKIEISGQMIEVNKILKNYNPDYKKKFDSIIKDYAG